MQPWMSPMAKVAIFAFRLALGISGRRAISIAKDIVGRTLSRKRLVSFHDHRHRVAAAQAQTRQAAS